MAAQLIGSSLVNSLLIWLHIFSAVGWFGAALFLTNVIAPLLPSLSATARSELLIRLIPRLIRYVRGFALMTLFWGLLLWYSVEGGMPGIRGDPFGAKIAVGAIIGLLAYLFVEARVFPTQRRLLRILQLSDEEEKKTASTSLPILQRRIRVNGLIVIVLLSLALIFMVTAHFYGYAQIIPGLGI